jgi:hypothetical protein
VRLAMASLLMRRDASSRAAWAGIRHANAEEGKHHV